jgi:hypothetical protein
LFQPALEAFAASETRYLCHRIPDEDYLASGALRCLSSSRTGRELLRWAHPSGSRDGWLSRCARLLQNHGDFGALDISVDHFFKAIQSKRRLKNLASINNGLSRLMRLSADDPFASISELDSFAIYAGDGHYHAAAVHDPKRLDRSGAMRKEAAGHFFLLDLRTHFLSHLTGTDQSGTRKREHDMHAMKRRPVDVLRGGQPKGTKVILAWDKAGIDFNWWHKVKCSSGLYFISWEKENMKLIRSGNCSFNREDPRNAGVVSDEYVGPGGGAGAMLRRITYIDPMDKTTYVYLTTEMTLPPGIRALIYKQRWDVEKTFDELKSKLLEKKAWGSSPTAKSTQAMFLCLTHNLMVLLEEDLRRVERIDNAPERKRKAGRKEKAEESGANFVATALQRFTVRTLKFIRWLRNFVYRETSWEAAVARLRHVYASF